ncbi:MAG: GTPase HflX [bacterium]|nr:GTPase HflX [bacterium]
MSAYTCDVAPHLAQYREEEMERLASTAGARVVVRSGQNLKSVNPATYIGAGKVDEIKALIGENEIDLVLFSNDLSPVQQRNLEKKLSRRIVDRTELILDIFAQHAQSRDGKIQVELAQLRYLRPRLTGRGVDLSRLGGGIGTRGPGETKLEIDRRRIDNRIARLRDEWEKVRNARRLQRKSREREGLTTAVLVGYTNAGKSTLLNRMTSAQVTARDQLFSTVDTTTRRLFLPDERRVLVSDTVGFISDLPKALLAAFRATLEVVEEAGLLLHVVDASSPFLDEQLHAVNEVLVKLECDQKPVLVVFNKFDLVEDDHGLRELEHQVGRSVRCSALKDPDMLELKTAMSRALLEAEKAPPPPPREISNENWTPLDDISF